MVFEKGLHQHTAWLDRAVALMDDGSLACFVCNDFHHHLVMMVAQ